MPLFGLKDLTYREDKDLFFLEYAQNDDLHTLLEILAGKKGDRRVSEEITNQKKFKECGENYNEIWDLIAAELQSYGGDSIFNACRGQGVPYREVLGDVCKHLKVRFHKDDKATDLEIKLLKKMLSDSLKKMSQEDLEAFSREAGLKLSQITPAAIMAAAQATLWANSLATYEISALLANAVSRLTLNRGIIATTDLIASRAFTLLAGPVGLALNVALTIPLFSGPAFRVTIPACIYVAYMRQKYINQISSRSFS